MDKNPICSEGYKNISCPFYSDCLDHAVEHWWDYWTCLECQHKQTHISVYQTPRQDLWNEAQQTRCMIHDVHDEKLKPQKLHDWN